MTNNNMGRPVLDEVKVLPELMFDLGQDKPETSAFGKTNTPMNQLPELEWNCTRTRTEVHATSFSRCGKSD